MSASPIAFTETVYAPELPPPDIGEHNDPVLRDLGFSDDDIAAMRDSGAI